MKIRGKIPKGSKKCCEEFHTAVFCSICGKRLRGKGEPNVRAERKKRFKHKAKSKLKGLWTNWYWMTILALVSFSVSFYLVFAYNV